MTLKHEAYSFQRAREARETRAKLNTEYAYCGKELVYAEPFKRAYPKVGRNEKCPCGSGKKFKLCCGKP